MYKILDTIKSETSSEISRDIAQVFFAGIFVGPLIDRSVNVSTLIMGLFLSVAFWTFSLVIEFIKTNQ